MPRGSLAPLKCNLCWSDLQPPFLVTSCNHCFCMAHKDHDSIQHHSCPGCNGHLSERGGIKQANYEIKSSSDLSVLNGVTPDCALKVAGTSISFWVSQMTNQLQYAHANVQDLQERKEQTKAQFQQAINDLQGQTQAHIEEKDQALAQNEELSRDNQMLQNKYHEAEQRNRALEEAVVQLKRKRGSDSPLHNDFGGRSPGHQPAPPPRSPLIGQPPRSPLVGQHQMASPGRGQPGLMPQSFGGSNKSLRVPSLDTGRLSTPSRLGVGGSASRLQSPARGLQGGLGTPSTFRMRSPARNMGSGSLGLSGSSSRLGSGLSGGLGRSR